MPLPELFAELPAPFRPEYDPAAPWNLLGAPLDALLDALPSEQIACAIGPGVHLRGDRIAIGKGTRILPGAVIEGPIWIGEEVEIRPGAYLRGGCWLGPRRFHGCVAGVKRNG